MIRSIAEKRRACRDHLLMLSSSGIGCAGGARLARADGNRLPWVLLIAFAGTYSTTADAGLRYADATPVVPRLLRVPLSAVVGWWCMPKRSTSSRPRCRPHPGRQPDQPAQSRCPRTRTMRGRDQPLTTSAARIAPVRLAHDHRAGYACRRRSPRSSWVMSPAVELLSNRHGG